MMTLLKQATIHAFELETLIMCYQKLIKDNKLENTIIKVTMKK